MSFALDWTQTINDAGGPIALSSPNVAMLAGGPAVVVGDRAGHVYAFNLASGAGVPGWPVSTGGVPVDSTPSVADTGSGLDSVFVGVGNAATPTSGGYLAITPQGATMWFVNVQNPSTDTAPAKAVQASMAVGDLNGATDVVAGSLGEVGQAMNAANGAMLAGFPWFQADSNFTTPALGDVYGNGRTDIVEGGDSSAGSAYGTTYTNGGHLRVLSPTGNAGTGNPGGGLVCQYNTDQTVQSSPAVGEFGGSVGIVFGTGATFAGATTTNDLIEVNSHCSPRWIDKLDGTTTCSPALADILGNGQLDVLEGTRVGSAGSIWALNGVTGRHHLARGHGRAGHRLGGHRRSHRWRVPGRHRADHGRCADLRREVRRLGRHLGPERRPGLPELAAGHRRPQRHHRHHHRGLQLEQPGSHPALRGRRVARVPRSTRPGRGPCSTTTRS